MSAKKTNPVTIGYAVLADANRHTAIRIGETRRYVLLIPLAEDGLQVVQVSHDRYLAEWAEIHYPIAKAARLYLDSDIGKSSTTSSEARDCLETIITSFQEASSQSHTSPKKEIDIMATDKKPAASKTSAAPAKAAAAKSPAKPAAKPAAPAKAATGTKPSAAAKKPAAKPAKAAVEGRASYAGKTIVHKVKSVADAGLREGSGRAKMLAYVLKHTDTDKVLGHDIGDGVVITGANLAGMIERGHIALK